MKADRWPHPACAAVEDLLDACDLRRGKASGPGGQRRNKVATAVDLTHRETGLRARATERRKAEDNRREALFRLRLALAVSVILVIDVRIADADHTPTASTASLRTCSIMHATRRKSAIPSRSGWGSMRKKATS